MLWHLNIWIVLHIKGWMRIVLPKIWEFSRSRGCPRASSQPPCVTTAPADFSGSWTFSYFLKARGVFFGRQKLKHWQLLPVLLIQPITNIRQLLPLSKPIILSYLNSNVLERSLVFLLPQWDKQRWPPLKREYFPCTKDLRKSTKIFVFCNYRKTMIISCSESSHCMWSSYWP